MRKSEVLRPYPPDFCSAETLAYRLDCSQRAVHDYAASGLLPKPVIIGNLSRWSWSEVCEHIGRMNAGMLPDRMSSSEAADDEYAADIARITPKARKAANGPAS